MFVSRPKVFHGKNLVASPSTMTDHRVRVKASVVASNTHTITTHTSDVTSVCFSHSTLATCSADRSVRLWNVKDFSELPVSPLLGHTFLIHCCSFSPLGSILATCSTDGTLRLWDVKTGQEVAILMHPSKNAIRVCQFSSDGAMMITGGDDDLACLWNMTDKKLIRTLQGHEETVTSAAFSPDGSYVVTGSSGGDYGGELLLWDAKYGHGRPLARVHECHDLGVSCSQFSPTYGVNKDQPSDANSRKQFLLATGGKDNLVKLWKMDCEVGSLNASIKLKMMLPGHTDSVLWLCFSNDGVLLASSSLDKTVRLWSVDTEQTLLVLDSHERYVSSCAFSNDRKTLATASGDNTLKIWNLTDTSAIMDGLNGYEAKENATDGPFSQVAMETWSVEDVCHWLEWLGLSEYEENFRKNAIDGKELLALTAADLEHSLGVGALGHRNKLLRSRTASQQQPIASGVGKEDGSIPDEFVCPISHELMKDPVIACDGYTYDRPAITSWMSRGESRSPMTNVLLPSTTLTPNRTLKMMIQKFLQQSE